MPPDMAISAIADPVLTEAGERPGSVLLTTDPKTKSPTTKKYSHFIAYSF